MRRLFKIEHLYARSGIERDVCITEENGKVVQKIKKSKISGQFDAVYNLKGVVLPSFVNAHTHLELTAKQKVKGSSGALSDLATCCLLRDPGFSLWSWIIDVVKTKRSWSDEDFEKHIKSGEKILRENATGVAGDVRSVLPEAPCFFDNTLNGTVFFEVLGYEKSIFNAKWEAAKTFLKPKVKTSKTEKFSIPPLLTPPPPAGGSLVGGEPFPCPSRKGISIHSLYTTPFGKAREILNLARKSSLPVMMHLGETEYEDRLFFDGDASGFKKIFPDADFESKGFRSYGEIMDFLEMAEDCIVVHGVQFKETDWETVKRRDISAVICPRSNLYFTGKLPDIKKVIDLGIRWGLGSDSLFTNVDLDVLAEARFLHACNGRKKPYGNEILYALTYGGRDILGMDNDGITAGENMSFAFFPGNISKENNVVKTVLESEQKPIYCKGATDYGLLESFKE